MLRASWILLLLLLAPGPAAGLDSCFTCGDDWLSQQKCNQTVSTAACPYPNKNICATRVKNEEGVTTVQKQCWDKQTCHNLEADNAGACPEGEVPRDRRCLYCCDSPDNCNWDRLTYTPSPPQPDGLDDCVRDCSDTPNGDYQSCYGCDHFVKCSNGYIYYMDCPADLVWDDNKKRCEWESDTCDGWQPSNCVSDCTDMPDGDYQSCRNCYEHVKCSNGYLFYFDCPPPTVWDDNEKRCEWTSTTCGECSMTCTGLENGSYHSCKGCSFYKTCKDGNMAESQCPAGKWWNDGDKSCSWTSATCNGPTGPSYCVNDCNGVANGDYQSCYGCDHFVKCSNGLIYYFDCPSDLVWDDIIKRCEWESDTCNGFVPSDCVSNCGGMANGDYQSCRSCHEFVSCSNELLYYMPCPDDLVWDDNMKRCEWDSDTCRTCAMSCEGRLDGRYHSCKGCSWYATCEKGIMTEDECPQGQTWDDSKKECTWASSTCSAPSGSEKCVRDCVGIDDGDYQSCDGCDHFVKCSNGYIYYMDCPADLVWDDNKKRCEWESDTCDSWQPSNCVSDCTDMPDGDYQSCRNCDEHVKCSNYYIHYFDCPPPTVWDDKVKRCEWTSTTCRECSSSCEELDDGRYHSCKGCAWYMTCEGGSLTEDRCPVGKFWDDDSKECSWTTATCNGPSEPEHCVDDCSGKADGDYQSCQGCDHFAACSNGDIYYMPCPEGLVWDDIKKRCEWQSDTCDGFVPENCVSNCRGMANGDHQSCRSCHEFVSCSNELLYYMPCPADLVWDDNFKQCEWRSYTCTTCLMSCDGMPDGDYQSCRGCSWFSTCEGGEQALNDTQCPQVQDVRMHWDDDDKECSFLSQTCGNNGHVIAGSAWGLALAFVMLSLY